MYRGLVVLVFARTFDDNLASLVKEIDRVIDENPDTRIGSYVNFLGDDLKRLKNDAAKFGDKHKIKHVPLVVPLRNKQGPKRLKIHPDAEVTVIIYQMKSHNAGEPNKVVKVNYAFGKGDLKDEGITAVVVDIERHLP